METHELVTARLDVDNHVTLRIQSEDGSVALTGTPGRIPGISSSVPRAKPEVTKSDTNLLLTWPRFGSMTLEHSRIETNGSTGHKYTVTWTVEGTGGTLADGISLKDSHWYGGAQLRNIQWPLEKLRVYHQPYVTRDSFSGLDWGGIQERYWLNSKGVAIFVDEDVPLFVSFNDSSDQSLSLVSKWNAPYKNVSNKNVFLRYSIYQGSDVRACHDHVVHHVFSKPSDIPDELTFRHPIWSTWAKFKKDVNHDVVLKFADEITENGFGACQLEIDDDWTPSYGDMEFDTKKFPDAAQTIQTLRDKGFRVTLWVHPFASPFSKASSLDHWCRAGILPGVTTWWNGVAKILDVTSDEAVTWYKNNLKELQTKLGLISYKFDAGETNWLPKFCKTKDPMESPNTYTKKYAEMCYSIDPDVRALEVRVGARTQHLPVWVRMMDKDSNWGWDNGLKTLIPHALTMSVIGYPFILPDMIGGNAYPHPAFPEKELFIRWLQANVFLPCLQFSIAPWQYDEEVVKISRKMTKLHEDHADLFIQLARESTRTGAPIIRPLWWVAPTDPEALTVDSEFLVGNDLLVAPVLDQGSVSRDVYLPAGRWRCESKQEVLDGATWHRQLPARLDELLWFTRLPAEDTTEVALHAPQVATSTVDATNTNTVVLDLLDTTNTTVLSDANGNLEVPPPEEEEEEGHVQEDAKVEVNNPELTPQIVSTVALPDVTNSAPDDLKVAPEEEEETTNIQEKNSEDENIPLHTPEAESTVASLGVTHTAPDGNVNLEIAPEEEETSNIQENSLIEENSLEVASTAAEPEVNKIEPEIVTETRTTQEVEPEDDDVIQKQDHPFENEKEADASELSDNLEIQDGVEAQEDHETTTSQIAGNSKEIPDDQDRVETPEAVVDPEIQNKEDISESQQTNAEEEDLEITDNTPRRETEPDELTASEIPNTRELSDIPEDTSSPPQEFGFHDDEPDDLDLRTQELDTREDSYFLKSQGSSTFEEQESNAYLTSDTFENNEEGMQISNTPDNQEIDTTRMNEAQEPTQENTDVSDDLTDVSEEPEKQENTGQIPDALETQENNPDALLSQQDELKDQEDILEDLPGTYDSKNYMSEQPESPENAQEVFSTQEDQHNKEATEYKQPTPDDLDTENSVTADTISNQDNREALMNNFDNQEDASERTNDLEEEKSAWKFSNSLEQQESLEEDYHADERNNLEQPESTPDSPGSPGKKDNTPEMTTTL